MKHSLIHLTLAGLLAVSAAATAPHAQAADRQAGPPSRILVLGQDGGPDMPRRDSVPYRILTERLSAGLDRDGYKVFQESDRSRDRRDTANVRRNAQQAIAAAQHLKRPAMDMAVVLSVRPEVVKRKIDGKKKAKVMTVRLTGQLVDLPSGQVLDTVALRAVSDSRLERDCNKGCKTRKAVRLTRRLADDFTEEVAARLAKSVAWKDEDAKGYSVVLQDFRPKELKRMIRTLDDYSDRLDYWSVGRTERSRILWVETAAKPRQIKRAINRLLDKSGLEARVIRSDRGFTIIRARHTRLAIDPWRKG
ncbi:hypothetical protein [Magnetospira sp. QH-2]|uniref:hypothetical protein n=1 Tax=Magnetospira sp. (strain QH-2) TaxID=1288970 RepID=UPI0003E81AE2|nr:hypothetical protein [Magnetospira sp. QH-2]CCQ75275.1 exported protein of unknown function [Magnetospira sp. QH-2]